MPEFGCDASRGGRITCARDVAAETEIVRGDVLEPASLATALQNVSTAYYLVHSMGSAGSFEEKDREGARNFAAAAQAAGVRRIIYLGGLGDSSAELSTHLRSRHEVGEVLRESGVQVIEFRASIIIGSGSLSFEMVRALAERLPVMITPKWVAVKAQPIAIGDMIDYLLAALKLEVEGSPIYEIGGADIVSYGDILGEYSRQRGLHRLMIPVPVLTPRLSSLWLGLVTPLYARVGRKLIDSMIHPTVVRDDAALKVFSIRPRGMREAIALALHNEDQDYRGTRWSDAMSAAGEPRDWGGVTVRQPPRRFARDPRRCSAAEGIRANPAHWWHDRMVLRRVAVAVAGFPRPAGRRSRDATRQTRCCVGGGWRRGRLLARRDVRSSATAQAGSRDAPPGPRVARLRSRRGRERVKHQADGNIRSGRAAGNRVLVRDLSAAPTGFRRHAARNRARSGGC